MTPITKKDLALTWEEMKKLKEVDLEKYQAILHEKYSSDKYFEPKPYSLDNIHIVVHEIGKKDKEIVGSWSYKKHKPKHSFAIKDGEVKSQTFDFMYQDCKWMIEQAKSDLLEYIKHEPISEYIPEEKKDRGLGRESSKPWLNMESSNSDIIGSVKKISAKINTFEWFKSKFLKNDNEEIVQIEVSSSKTKNKYLIDFNGNKAKITMKEFYKDIDRVPISPDDAGITLHRMITAFESGLATFNTNKQTGIVFK